MELLSGLERLPKDLINRITCGPHNAHCSEKSSRGCSLEDALEIKEALKVKGLLQPQKTQE